MIVSLENKTILITGASSGIGRQVAMHCAESGANLILTGRDESKLKETCASLKKGKHKSLAGDLTDENFIISLCEITENIDGIVHSAGIIYPLPTKFIRRKHLDEVMNINYFSPVLLTSKLLKENKINPASSLVFISSISTKHPYFGGSLYVGSKAAIEAYAHTLALELAPNKTRVNLISPGLVKTKILEETINASGTDGVTEYEKQYPLGFGEPEDIADMIVF